MEKGEGRMWGYADGTRRVIGFKGRRPGRLPSSGWSIDRAFYRKCNQPSTLNPQPSTLKFQISNFKFQAWNLKPGT